MYRTTHRSQIALAILGCFGGGSLYGWSGYLPAVRANFAVSNAAASMVFSLALVSFTLGVLLGPTLVVRIPHHLRLAVIAGFAAVSLGISGASSGFAGFALSYGVFFGFTSGVLYNFAISQASASGSANILVPVSVAAFGLGGAVFGPVHLWLTALGWALWSILPALVCLATVAIVAVLTISPTEIDQPRQQTAVPMVKPDRRIMALWVIFAAGSFSGLIVLGFASQIVSRGGSGVGFASLAVFFAALGNTLGRLSSALIASRFGPAGGIAGASVLSIFALVGLIIATVPSVVVAILFFVALAYGQLAATMPLLVRSQVSGPAFSGSFGWVFMGWGVAGLLGPWTAGWLLDMTGSLQIPLFACIALAALSLILVLSIAEPKTTKTDY